MISVIVTMPLYFRSGLKPIWLHKYFLFSFLFPVFHDHDVKNILIFSGIFQELEKKTSDHFPVSTNRNAKLNENENETYDD